MQRFLVERADPAEMATTVTASIERLSDQRVRLELQHAVLVCRELAYDANCEKQCARRAGERSLAKVQRLLGQDIAMLPSLQKLVTANATVAMLRHEVQVRQTQRMTTITRVATTATANTTMSLCCHRLFVPLMNAS